MSPDKTEETGTSQIRYLIRRWPSVSVYNHDCLRIDWTILKSVIHAKKCSPYGEIKTHLIGDLGNPGLLLVLYWLACCGGKHSSMSHLRRKDQHSKQQRHHKGWLSKIFKKKGEWRRKWVWNMAKGNKENQLINRSNLESLNRDVWYAW